MSNLHRDFQLAGYQTQFTRQIPGIMGRKDGASTWTYATPDANYTYVRLGDGSSSSLIMAINRAGVSNGGDKKLWLQSGQDGRWYIIGVRY